MGVQINSFGKGVLDYWDYVDVTGNTTATAIGSIAVPANSIVKEVLAQVLTSFDAATSASLTVGDGDDPDGYLVAADVKATAGTIYGNAAAEVGDNLISTTDIIPGGYFYANADTIDAVVTITGTNTTGKVRVFAHIIKLYQD
jgi:hypothetical protein